jgi:hypothetical protein
MFWCALPMRPWHIAGLTKWLAPRLASMATCVSSSAMSMCWPCACALGVAQRRQNADGCVHAGEEVGHGNAHLLRTAALVVAFASHAHQPAHALDGM